MKIKSIKKYVVPTRSIVPGLLSGIDYNKLINIQASGVSINNIDNSSLKNNGVSRKRSLNRKDFNK